MMKGFSKPNSERQGKTISYRRRSTFLSLFERHIRMQIHFRPGNNFESMLEKKKRKKEREREKREREREREKMSFTGYYTDGDRFLNCRRFEICVLLLWFSILEKQERDITMEAFFLFLFFFFSFFFFPSRFHSVDKEKKRDYSQAHEISRLT